MKINFTSKFKIWVLITVAILIIGFVLFGVFGFNQNANYKNSYKLDVKVDANIGDASKILKSTTDKYLSDNKVKFQTVDILDDGGELVYNFTQDVKGKIDVGALTLAIKANFASNPVLAGLTVDATLNNATSYTEKAVVGITIALAILAVAMFVYVLIMEKLGGAVATLATSVISALLFFALVAATRIPASPYMGISVAVAFIFGGVYSSVLVNRFNNSLKNNSSKLSTFEIVNKDTSLSLFRFAFVSIALIVFGLIMVIVGNTIVRALGLQAIVLAVCCFFSSIAFTGIVWASISAKAKYKPAKEIAKDTVEEVQE